MSDKKLPHIKLNIDNIFPRYYKYPFQENGGKTFKNIHKKKMCNAVSQKMGCKKKSLKRLTAALVSALLGMPFYAQADSITYDGTIPLQGRPNGTWNFVPNTNLLYPGSAASPRASNNIVTVDYSSGTKPEGVFGGMFNQTSGVSENNTVYIVNGDVQSVYGGYSSDYDDSNSGQLVVQNNTVYVSSSDKNLDEVFGGMAVVGRSQKNNVFIDGGNITVVAGGMVQQATGDALDNYVEISGGTFQGSVYGGLVNFAGPHASLYRSGNANGNKVKITGGEYYSNLANSYHPGIAGGSTFVGYEANNNVVDISGSPIIHSTSYDPWYPSNAGPFWIVGGGNVFGRTAVGNTVNISGTPQISVDNGINFIVISGGLTVDPSDAYAFPLPGDTDVLDGFTGNTLNYSAHPIDVYAVQNFEFYNFTIDPQYANTSTALINADQIYLENDALKADGTSAEKKRAKIEVVGIHSGKILEVNDKFVLMEASTLHGDSDSDGAIKYGVAQQGISLLYDVRTDVDKANNRVTATILGSVGSPDMGGSGSGGSGSGGSGSGISAARVNPQLKALSEGALLSNQLVNRGGDLLAYNVFAGIKEQNHLNGWVPFIISSAQRSRYNSGSHVDSNEYLLTGGITYQENNMTSAVLLEGGWDSYDSYNSFYNASSVHGHGNSNYYGLALLGRYDFDNGFYTEGSLRYGRRHIEFSTDDITNYSTGERAKYKLNTNYVSAHAGVGYILPLNETNNLDLSFKYLYTSTKGKNVNVAGDNIQFKRVNSNRVRLNGQLNHQYNNTVNLNVGAGYEYEFSGKAKATTYGTYEIDAPSLRGGTGIVSIGATITPKSNDRLSFYVKGQGYAGKREGVGVSFKIEYAF